MEVVSNGMHWVIKNTRGPVPTALGGEWSSKHKAEEAVGLFQQKIHSKAINVTQKSRERKERAANRFSESND
jgi:hypothetical protein